MRSISLTGAAVLALLLSCAWLAVSGCASSPPMRFYTLSPVGGDGASANGASSIRVGRVTLPGEIDRQEIVQRLDANRVKLAEEDRWAAPLGEMIRRTLSADLQARAPGTGAEPDVLSVDIDELIGDASCAVSLRAAWNLKRAGAGTEIAHGYENIHIAPSGSCEVGAIPEGMSRALAELSGRVASARTK